jgi:hypothetical protein
VAIQTNKLKFGIVGMSDGNGHPYSWSAIFNGFNMQYMKDCPFPVIPEYLANEQYPENFLGHLAIVTHIWTQDIEISKHISKASNIPFVVELLEDMIGEVDAVLLARDDAENHLVMAETFIKKGVPIFIDKPLAFSLNDAEKLLNLQIYDSQIFTCSSLRYALELMPDQLELQDIGKIIYVEASIPKSWEKYAVHIIEPVIRTCSERGTLLEINSFKHENIVNVKVKWESLLASFTTYGKFNVPIEIRYFGEKGSITKTLQNTFNAFKNSLNEFVKQVILKKNLIPREETFEIIKIIENGV